MAVVLEGAVERYVGLSTDTKPASPRPGSRFWETDSRMVYVYDGTAWQLTHGEAWR